MSFLFGSAPKVTTTTQPTINPDQQSALSSVLQLLTGGGKPAGVQAYGGQFGAGLSHLQQTSLTGLENSAGQVPPVFDPNAAFEALTKSLNFGGPDKVTAPGVGTTAISSTHIDPTQAFTQGVVEPLTKDFLGRTLPAIAGKYGAGAGGAYSSDALHARGQAGEDLGRTLAAEGSKYALGAATANQQADLTAGLSNQRAYETAQLANATNTLSADQINTGAGISTQDAVLRALGITPSVASTGITESGGMIDNLLKTLSGGAVPQQTEQTELTGRYSDFLNQITQGNTRLADLIGLGTGRTQDTQSVATGGSSGVVPGLLQAFATPNALTGASGITSLLALLSDRRAKTDVELVGEVDGFPLYRYVYKDDPGNVVHIGLMAQDVEKRKPHAVGRTPEGLKTVNYATALEDVLKKAA